MVDTPFQLGALDTLSWLLVTAGGTLVAAWAWTAWRAKSVRDGRRARDLSGDAALGAVAIDAEELTQRLAAKADAHAARLEALIAEADARLTRLESSLTPECTRRPKTSCAKFQAVAEAKPATAVLAAPRGDLLSRRVYELADDGLPAVDIARRLDEHLGKVELILALRDR